MRGLLVLSLASSLLSLASLARAGCPNLCEIQASAAVVEPPLPCMQVDVQAEDCD